ncbi:unnamed protein product [Diatraea saccharalis]|uniref:Uncharacterized protein n=1 Tax=Diatraea saccharalis TaxID=40085 RepID=A0A9N9R2B0_9NEOP|nr:unnamed protein product [Diatraea saccharalis]
MKFTVVFIASLCLTSSLAIKVKKTEEPKDKREAPVGYPSLSSHNYQPSLGQDDASAISIGAGYSVGGAKPSYSLEGSSGGAQYQLAPEALQPSSHGTIQLAPITLQPSHGQAFASADLSQLMSQLSHGLNSGALQLQTGESYQQAAHGGGQELSLPQYTFAGPQVQQYAVAEQPSVPSYAAGTKGLGSYSTGPVLFSPSDSQGQTPALTYGAPNSGHSLGGASGSGHSLGGAPGAGHAFLSVPSSAHGFGSLSSSSLSSGGHSFGDGGYSLGNSGHSLGALPLGSGHSFGGSIKGLSPSYGAPSKNSFKPSAFLGASVQGESGHGLSSLSGSYGAPSFGAFSDGGHGGFSLSSAGHGASLGGSLGGFGGGSTKFVAPGYLPPKSVGFGSSLESVASFASDGHIASPPGTTYGVPTSSYGLPSSATQAASSSNPQYHVPSKSSFPSFGSGSSSYRGPSSGHASLSSFSSGPKHIYSSHSGPRYSHPKEIQGAHSESSYNTIKYSEELKPRGH